MNKEEAMKILQHYLEMEEFNNAGYFLIAIDIILNLIQKQEEEIKELKEDISNMYDEKVVRNILEDECGLSKYEIDEILN